MSEAFVTQLPGLNILFNSDHLREFCYTVTMSQCFVTHSSCLKVLLHSDHF